MASTINSNTSSGVVVTSDTSGVLQLQTASTTAVTIDASQNVGVGVTPSAWTTSGSTKAIELTNGVSLSSYGSAAGLYQNAYVASGGYTYKTTAATTAYQQAGGVHYWLNAPSGTAGAGITYTQAMTLDTSGNLLIGATSASAGAQGLQVNLSGTAGNQIGFSSQGNSNGQTIWTNTNTGNWRLTFAFGGTNIGTYGVIQFDNSGNAYKASGAGSWLATSDIRIKTNIELVTDGLTRILELKPRTFDYKQPEAHQGKVHDKGFIADEYELVYPDSVIDSELVNDLDRQYTSDDKTLKAMSFNAEFYADLVSSIQELSAQVTELKAEVALLKGV